MSKHAVLSPSGSHLWLKCEASPRMQQMHPDVGDKYYADQGTAAHFLASTVLERFEFEVPDAYYALTIYVNDGVASWQVRSGSSHTFIVDAGMIENVNAYLESIREYLGYGELLVEQRLDISKVTGEEGATGTADAVIINGSELQVHDLKYGMGEVEAKHNPQLLIYAMAAYEEHSPFVHIDSILIKIHQPRRGVAPEWRYTLEEFGLVTAPIGLAAARAKEALDAPELEARHFHPGSHCTNHYCDARANCLALAEWCTEGIVPEERPVDMPISWLSEFAKRVPTIQSWCKAVTERLNGLVLSGEHVPGFKAVLGREGNRTWVDEAEVEGVIQGMKLNKDIVYTQALRSAPQMIKQFEAGKIGPRQWKKLEPLITRAGAKPTVVPEEDKRPAINIWLNDFKDLTDV